MDSELQSAKHPFKDRKIPVSHGTRGFQELQAQYPDFFFCPYLAHKDEEGWHKSTSRVYMNQILPNFLYAPVDILKDDHKEIRAFFNDVRDKRKIVAVNITQPHKSNPVLMEEFSIFDERPTNIDTLIRNQDGLLIPYDLNAPSFMGWYQDEVGDFNGRTVVLIGVGGVGEPIARRLVEAGPTDLVLVDPADKSKLVSQLQKKTQVTYRSSLSGVALPENQTAVVVINAAGKEAASDNSGLYEWLQKAAQVKGIFIDMRPQLKIDMVQQANSLGWRGFTGHGMNARNDYALLEGIARVIGSDPPTFEEFKDLVAKAS
jgi:shikimate 5-dehydrogenase